MRLFSSHHLFSSLRGRRRRDAPLGESDAAAVGCSNRPPLRSSWSRSPSPPASLSSSPESLPAPPPPSPSLPASSPPPVPVPPLLQLPIDIVLYLCRKYLWPASAAALSLTCKDLFALVFPEARPDIGKNTWGRENLLLLLERDLGQHWWYCDGCSLLHPVTTIRGPGGGGHYGRSLGSYAWDPVRPHHSKRYLEGSGFWIDHQSVRSAINRHILGPPFGLPLENFNIEAISTSGSLLPWQEKWSARIIQDELFLSATRTLSGAGWDDKALRAALDDEWREICGHVRTAHNRRTLLPVKALRRPTPLSAAIFTPCRNLVDSCPRCLTDYATTVERKLESVDHELGGTQPVAYWFITITSYYQLGSGRWHLDAKWKNFGTRMTGSAYLMERDFKRYPQGAVKAAWEFFGP